MTPVAPWAVQHGFDVRAAWGSQGLEALLAGGVATVVVVDVLRWSTAVDVACGRGAAVVPFAGDDEQAAADQAGRLGGRCGAWRPAGGDTSVPSLSPVSLRLLEPGTLLVLPSPNGSALAAAAGGSGAAVLSGCLRNAAAVAGACGRGPVGIVAAGERWPDGTLRPATEDGLGAGAVARHLHAGGASLSPEARVLAAGVPPAGDLPQVLLDCTSGRELVDAGWSLDVEVAAALDVSRHAPLLHDGAFRA